jgi:hypothetical protein
LGATLSILSEGDAGSGATSGFYKIVSCRGALASPATFFPSSDQSYSMYLQFAPLGGTTVTTTPVTFYVDSLSGAPTITSLTMHTVSGSTQFVTGVPSLTASTTIGFQITMSNLVSRFLRSDLLHFHADVQTSSGTTIGATVTVSKTSINGTTRSYYAAPMTSYALSTSSLGGTLSVNPGTIQFHEFSITLSNSSGRFDENLRLAATAYNLDGTTSSMSSGHTDPSTGTVKPLRIDSPSLRALTVMAGTLMTAGSGQFPSIDSLVTYTDHTTSIANTDQLQLVNGSWSSRGVSGAYRDYTGFLHAGPDYTSVSASGFRYVCIRFQNLKVSGTYDAVTLGFVSSGLTLTPSSDSANFRLYVRVVGTITTPWVSATASINPSGYGAISTDGQGAMDNANAAVGSIRVYVPTGTPATATVYVRFGLDMAHAQTVSQVTCTAV